MATTIDELQVIISANNAQFSQKLNETNNQVANLSKNISRSFRGVSAGAVMAGSVLSSVLSTAFRAVSASVDKAVERLDTLNNFPRVMSNLGISASESQKTIQYLSDKLVGLPTTINEAALSVQRLTSANGNIKASTAMFLAMNNAILAGGAPMDLQRSALEQLSQAYTKGVPDMMEWRTMMMAMPAQLKQVAMAMNLPSADQLGEALRNGQVSMNDFMATMVKLNNQGIAGFQSFADQAKNSTGGVATAIANLKTAIVRAVSSIMDAIGQANISGFISTIANSINAVVPYIVGFTKVVMEAVGWVVGLFGGTIKTTKSIQTSAQSAGASVGKIANNAGNATKALGGAQKAAKKLKGTLASFDEMNVLEAPRAAAGGGKSGGGGAGGGAGGGGAGGASVAMPTVDYGNKLNDVAGKADAIAKKIKDFLQGAFNLDWNKIAQAFGKFWNDLKKAAEPVGRVIGDIWKNYLKPLVTWTGNSLLPAVLNALGGAIRFVAAVLESAWTSFIKPFMDFFVVPIAKFAGSLLVDTLNAIGDGLRKLSGDSNTINLIAAGVTVLGAAIAGSAIVSWFNNAAAAVRAFTNGAATFKTLQEVIGGPMANIVKFAIPVVESFKNIATFAIGLKDAFVLAGGGFAGLQAVMVALGDTIKTSVLSAFTAIMAHPLVLAGVALIGGLVFVFGSLSAAMHTGTSEEMQQKAQADALKKSHDGVKQAVEGVKKAEDDLSNARASKIDAQIAYTQAIDQQKKAHEDLANAVKQNGVTYEELVKQVDNGSLSYENMTPKQQAVYNAGLQLDKANQQVESSQGKLNKATEDAKNKQNDLKNALDQKKASLEADAVSQAVISGKYKNTQDAIKALKDGTLQYKDEHNNMTKANSGDVERLEGTIRGKANDIVRDYNNTASGAKAGFFGPMGVSLNNAGKAVGNWARDAGNALSNWARDAGKSADDAKHGLEKGLGDLGRWGSDRWNDLKNAFRDAWGAFKNIGGNILRGLGEGIGNVGNWLKDKFNGAVNGVKKALGIHSPSRVFKSIGDYMSQGMSIGFDKNLGNLVTSASELSDQINSKMALPLFDTPSYSGTIEHTLTADIASAIQASPISLTVNLGNEHLIDQAIRGINDRSFLNNQYALNI